MQANHANQYLMRNMNIYHSGTVQGYGQESFNGYYFMITRCNLSAAILSKLVDSYLIGFKFAQYCSINTKELRR